MKLFVLKHLLVVVLVVAIASGFMIWFGTAEPEQEEITISVAEPEIREPEPAAPEPPAPAPEKEKAPVEKPKPEATVEPVREKPAPAPKPKQADSFTNSLGMTFVWIEPGTFSMGSPAHEENRGIDERLHSVTLSKGYWMQTTSVTQGQWKAIMDSSPSGFFGCETCPVENVSWNDARAFISKLNQKENKAYRLPTEAEWEYAARAGTNTRYHFGDDAGQLGDFAWYLGNSWERTLPVGQKQPNAWGLYDMHGNVGNWCRDWYEMDYSAGTVTDPTGPETGLARVIRGGSWSHLPRYCRSAARDWSAPDNQFNCVGFRLVLPMAAGDWG